MLKSSHCQPHALGSARLSTLCHHTYVECILPALPSLPYSFAFYLCAVFFIAFCDLLARLGLLTAHDVALLPATCAEWLRDNLIRQIIQLKLLHLHNLTSLKPMRRVDSSHEMHMWGGASGLGLPTVPFPQLLFSLAEHVRMLRSVEPQT